MLGPPTETVRRPSSTADLILSRTDSLLPRDASYTLSPGDRYHAHLSPSDGSYSAPLSASPSACWTTTGASATSGSECSLSSTPRASPEARKRYWCRRLMKLKEEMDRVGDGFRRSLRGSFDTLATRLSPSTRRQSRNGDVRGERLQGSGINVEIVREVRRQRTKSADRSRGNSFRLEESTGGGGSNAGRPISDFKFPSTLTLTGLRDGAFSGEIPLESATPAKSVIVRIRDYRLEFYVPGDCSTSERQTQQPQFVGAVSLPIYVDPGSLAFSLNSPDTNGGGMHQLLVDGRMKGCGVGVSDVPPRRLSVSTSDLSLLTSSPPRRQVTNLSYW